MVTKAMEPAAFWAPLEELVPWVANPRKHTDDDVAEMATRMRRFGFGPTIVAWLNAKKTTYPGGGMQPAGNRISIGHKRRLAARKIWLETPDFKFADAPAVGLVPVRFVSYASEDEFEKAATSDDATRSDYDTDLLGTILKRHAAGGEAPSAFGFTDERLRAIVGDAGKVNDLLGRNVLASAASNAGTLAAAALASAGAAAAGAGAPAGANAGEGLLRLPGPEATTKVAAIIVGKRRLPMTPDDQAGIEALISVWINKKGSAHGLVHRLLEAVAHDPEFAADLAAARVG